MMLSHSSPLSCCENTPGDSKQSKSPLPVADHAGTQYWLLRGCRALKEAVRNAYYIK